MVLFYEKTGLAIFKILLYDMRAIKYFLQGGLL